MPSLCFSCRHLRSLRFEAAIISLLGVLPSYTAVGMAGVLPQTAQPQHRMGRYRNMCALKMTCPSTGVVYMNMDLPAISIIRQGLDSTFNTHGYLDQVGRLGAASGFSPAAI